MTKRYRISNPWESYPEKYLGKTLILDDARSVPEHGILALLAPEDFGKRPVGVFTLTVDERECTRVWEASDYVPDGSYQAEVIGGVITLSLL